MNAMYFVIILILTLLLYPILGYSQSADYVIYYDFHGVKDTTTLAPHSADTYMLYRVDQISRFVNRDRYIQDSLTALFLSENPDPSQLGFAMTQKSVDLFIGKVHEFRAKHNFKLQSDMRVDKNFTQGLLMLYAEHSLPMKWMRDSIELLWKIHPKKEKYRGYQVQLASTTYGGRNYKVRFTQELPINDGPFVFSGLPGLIVSAEDDRGWFRFEIMDLQIGNTSVYFKEDFYGMKPQILSQREFAKWMYKEMKDPEIPIGLLSGSEELKLRLIEKRKDRFNLLIIR